MGINQWRQTMQKASARSNPPWGYKALAIHPNGRTEVLVRHGRRAGKNFATRAVAIAYAEAVIAKRAEFNAIRKWLYENRDSRGRRRTEDEAREALGLPLTTD